MFVFPSLSMCQIRFIDSTDPAGIDHQIAQIGGELASTLVIAISKVCEMLPLSSFCSFPFFSPRRNRQCLLEIVHNAVEFHFYFCNFRLELTLKPEKAY